MNLEAIHKLARALGASKVSTGNGVWARFPCPFAKWIHKPGSIDQHTSFGITITPGGASSYSCFTCHHSGNIINFYEDFRQVAKEHNHVVPYSPETELFILNSNQLTEEAVTSAFEGSFGYTWTKPEQTNVAGLKVDPGNKSASKEKEIPPPLPEETLTEYFEPLSEEAFSYLTGPKRRLSLAAIKEFELIWQPHARRIGIPIRSVDKKLMGVSGRAIDPDTDPRFLHSTKFPRDFILYGENLCIGEQCYLVEGFFDVHHLWDLGYRNVVAMMGTYLSDFQQKKIKNMFKSLKVIMDGDKAGYEGADRILNQLESVMDVVTVPMEPGKDPDDLTMEEAVGFIGPPEVTS